MENISAYFVRKFIKRNIINPDKAGIYEEGLKLITADIINFSAILSIGFLTKSFVYSCIYLLLFWTVRRFCGGFHAKTYTVCRIVTIGTFVLILAVSRIINQYFIVYVFSCDIIAIITMILFSPIRHPNKELTEKEVKANKLFSAVTTAFFSITSIVLTSFSRKEGLIISLTLLAITVLMYVGLLVNGKEENGNVKN